MWPVAASTLSWQSQVTATENVWPVEPKIFTIWPFPEKVSWPL